MAYRLIDVESTALSKETLVKHEGLARIPGERDLHKPRLKFITSLLVDELFNRCEWGTCRCLEDGVVYRSNGQHSSKLLRDTLNGKIADATFPEGIPVLISHYECDTKLDLADVFDMFDNPSSTRNNKDKLGIFMAQHNDLVGIAKETCNVVLAGIEYGVRHIDSIKAACGDHRPDSAYNRGMLLNVDEVRDFVDTMHQQSGAPFREWGTKTGIVARLFQLFLDDREKAELAIEQTLFEAGDIASTFTRKIRASCARTGRDQGYYYRATDKYLRALLKEIATIGPEGIKAMIREVMEEDSGEAA